MTAKTFGSEFVRAAKKASARVSFKGGVRNGTGNIPYDTGATQGSVYVAMASANKCTVRFDGEFVPYAVYLQYAENVGGSNVINQHKGFLQRFARQEFVEALRRKYGDVRVR